MTRLYARRNGTAPITPNVDGGWESSAAPFARMPLLTTTDDGDTLTTVSGFGSTSGQDRCHRQLISEPMAAGLTFDGAVTYKCYVQVLESAANDNIRSRIGVRILSEDGSTVRHTVLAIADYSTGAEWNTALRNKAFANGDAGSGSYTTVAGDRLVVEIGHNDSAGATISGSSRWGSAGSADLGENETSTSTTERPWFETSLTITFIQVVAPGAVALTAAPVAPRVDLEAAPAVLPLTASPTAPTIAFSVDPGAVALAIGLVAPSRIDQDVRPAAVALAASALGPDVASYLDAPAIGLATSVVAPRVDQQTEPGPVAITLTPLAPTRIDIELAPAIHALAATPVAPRVDTELASAVITLSIGVPAPTVTTGGDTTVSPAAIALVATPVAPRIDTDVRPDGITLTATVTAPRVDHQATPGAIALTLEVAAPTRIDIDVLAAIVALAVGAVSPEVTGGVTVSIGGTAPVAAAWSLGPTGQVIASVGPVGSARRDVD